MPGEEYIMSSKACVYVLGGEANTASLFDFDGVYVLDGGFADKSQGFVANVRECAAVILTAPTAGNLGTTAALLEKGNSLPVFTNTKPLKGAKSGSSGEVVKAIQEANSKLLSPTSLIFDPKYPAHVLYQSYSKGILSLYILAGDTKDAEVVTKALAGGNESEVEKAGAEHGTIGVLLWRPAEAEKPVVRVLVSGNSSLSRIQQSLDKAAKALPFLNAPTVKSKDALTAIPAPAIPRSAATNPAAKPAAAKPSRPTTAAPARALTSRAPAPTPPSSRPASKPAMAPARGAPAKPAPAKPAPAKPAAPAKAAPPSRSAPGAPKAPVSAPKAPVRSSAPRASAEPVALKKTVGKVQGAAPTKTSRPVAAKKDPSPPAASAPVTTPAPVAPAVPIASIVLDDVPIDLDLLPASGESHQQPVDIVLIPPTPEPPRHHDDEEDQKKKEAVPEPPKEVDDVANLADVEDEIQKDPEVPETPEEVSGVPKAPEAPEEKIPDPIDAFKKPEPSDDVAKEAEEKPETPKDVEDKIPGPIDAFKKPEPSDGDVAKDPLADFDPMKPEHPEPSAPAVPSGHVIISTPDPDLPDIAAAVPFVAPTPLGPNDGLIKLDDDFVKIAPGFEEPLIPQAPREDGTLADCSEELSKLVEISMDTDKSTEAGTALAEAIGDVTQLAAGIQTLALDEKTDEYVRKLSNQMIEEATMPFTSAFANSIVSNGSEDHGVPQEPNGHNAVTNGAAKHDLMQSRSSLVESNGAPVEYEKTDPALDDILNACAQESEKIDSKEVLHMPVAPGSAVVKATRFARPYYFDVVTAPRNEKLETTASAEGLQEFISKVRSRNVILASKEITGEQLQALLLGKQTWCDGAHMCTIIPTHSSPNLLDFRHRNEEQLATVHLVLSAPVEKQRTTVSSEAGATDYELAKVSLE
ncbi:hypothetical protein L5515_002723 [Caenorhabditis briggsae]|uniref:Microtubule-associated protein futsch n=1 Tax=Caenorhabditis briggsae TaxID=6238 RepID=A0AAE9J562_CAEBR|nr:hypothetical protein L5515_002723 [Caenorhabditis briggsae]